MRRQTEAAIQRAVLLHLRQRGTPGVLYFAVPNGGYRNAREAAMLKRQGVLAGVADLMLIHDGKVFGLELKAPGGRTSEAQLEFKSRLEDAGGYAAVAEGLDKALACLRAWGLLKS